MPSLSDIDKALLLVAVANGLVFCMFWFDKIQAREHGRRVPLSVNHISIFTFSV